MKGRTKKYLLFMFGNWKIIEKDSVIMNNIRDIMCMINPPYIKYPRVVVTLLYLLTIISG